MAETTILFRPVGQEELDLIRDSGFSEFPPRLAEQPIFYPVITEEYARQIARDWNAKHNEERVGYVTRFHVSSEYLKRYGVQTVGGSEHVEYWLRNWRSSIRTLSARLKLLPSIGNDDERPIRYPATS